VFLLSTKYQAFRRRYYLEEENTRSSELVSAERPFTSWTSYYSTIHLIQGPSTSKTYTYRDKETTRPSDFRLLYTLRMGEKSVNRPAFPSWRPRRTHPYYYDNEKPVTNIVDLKADDDEEVMDHRLIYLVHVSMNRNSRWR
jgi:hypothetical protein